MGPSPLHPLLRSRVAAIDIVEHAGGDTLVLPSTSVVLGLQFRGRVRAGSSLLAEVGVTGLQSSAQTYSYVGQTSSVLVRFTPQGAACLGVPVADLADQSVPLDGLLPRARVAVLRERLQAATDNPARVAVIQRFLMDLPYAQDRAVAQAIGVLQSAHESTSIAVVAKMLGMSERQLERRFLAAIGMTPKRFAMLSRFERAVAHARTAPSLAAAAQDAGYYDQSHFIRDFRRFANAAPSEHLLQPR